MEGTQVPVNPRFGYRSIAGAFALVLSAALAAIFISAELLGAAAPPADKEKGETAVDLSIHPGDDFYNYANRNWLRTSVPAGASTYDNRALLTERTSQRVTALVEEAASSHPAKGSVAQRVGDYYASFIDENAIETKGLAPLRDDLAKISAITNKSSLSTYLGSTLNSEVDGLIANSDHIFGLWINQGFQDADHNVVHLWQGGLGLPSRDTYLDASPSAAEQRTKYQAHIANILKIAGTDSPETHASRVLALETKIAQAFAPDSDAADVNKQNNPWKLADFAVKAPGMDWAAYFNAAGLADQSEITVWQPTDVVGVSALVAGESLDTWKDYLAFHLVEHYASVLPRTVSAENTDRKKLAITAVNGALGQDVSQLYTRRYFPPEAKAKAEAMSRDLIAAFRERIQNLSWMSPQTKQKALAKLAAFKLGIGYPDAWIDYSSLDVTRGDAFGNMRRAEAFIRSRNLAQLKQPVEPYEWPLLPHVPGAVIMFSPNAEFFSAAILQPPYFDYQGDSASNYGSAGAGMAHEISHSFDELGNIYDEKGRLHDWWTAEDRAAYHAAAAKLASQFQSYCPVSNNCVDGERTLNENISDLAGLLVAHDAYILSLHGTRDVVIEGLTGEQRFFLAFAHRWRKFQSEDALRKQLATDTHAPGEFRSDTVRNLDAWYKAFDVMPAHKLFLKPEERVRIW